MSYKQGIPLLKASEDDDSLQNNQDSGKDSDTKIIATKFKDGFTLLSWTWKYCLLAAVAAVTSVVSIGI